MIFRKLVYIVYSLNQNNCLWDKNLLVRVKSTNISLKQTMTIQHESIHSSYFIAICMIKHVVYFGNDH